MDAISTDFHPGIAHGRRSAVLTAALVIVWWAAAAFFVMLCDRELDHASPLLSTAVKALAIFATAAAYMHFAARHATTDHALFVGTGWLLLSIIAEVTMAVSAGHSWHALIGSPSHDVLRDVLLFSWVAAPAAFARYRS
jgi:hypothetical protein